MQPGSMTRRTWIGATAGALATLMFDPAGRVASPNPYPAIPSRVLNHQLDAAVRATLANAPAAHRRAFAAAAVRWFGATPAVGDIAVPSEIRDAVHTLITRG